MPSTPKLSLTDAIAMVESSNGQRMRSHNGQHCGYHMMGFSAWKDVNAAREKRGVPTHPYRDCFDRTTSTTYCSEYLALLANHLQRELGRGPSRREVLAAYRLGLTGFRLVNHDPAAVKMYVNAIEKYL